MPSPNPSPSRFSERETEAYYDAEDALYRSFWDTEGSLRWGVFDTPEEPGSGSDIRNGFLAACSRLTTIMPESSSIDSSARVLDLGCGNGSTYRRLSQMATTGNDPELLERFAALSDAYLKMVQAAHNDELGWAQSPCVKQARHD